MFEREVGSTTLSTDTLPPHVLAAFRETARRVSAFSLTPWKEHCTECAMPACYATCDLYEARRDGKCRRFAHGIETIPLAEHPQGYVAKVVFKRWGQLLAYANTRLVPIADAAAIERRAQRVETVAARFPGASVSVAARRGIPTRLAGRWKHRISTRAGEPLADEPHCLLVEVFNPDSSVVGLTLSVSNPDRPGFQARLELQPGFQAVEVPVEAMRTSVDLGGELLVGLDPNLSETADKALTLYFGLVAFVKLHPTLEQDRGVERIKVVVWDLDDTLWTGTLLEDGVEGVRLRDDVVEVIRELDRRGIVNSVLSKNHRHDGLGALRHFGIEEYFAFAKIGWGEKGMVMKELVRDFDVDVTAFAFIDDQAFERAEVSAANPGIRVYDARDAVSLPNRPEFAARVSAESSMRRWFYRAEELRNEAHVARGGDYLDFLRTCDLRIDIGHPDPRSIDRIHELVQRTNQLNYSGAHYSRAQADAIIDHPDNESFVVSCVDSFGDYGTVGFLVVDRQRTLLRDAMFSCRIHFKHVEHAALAFLMQLSRSRGAGHFDARFHETERNAAAASVFDDLGFRELSREGPDRVYRFDLAEAIGDEGIVRVHFEGEPWAPADLTSGA